MKVNLLSGDKKILTVLKEVGAQAQSLGYCAYLVGGVVRDLFLKRKSYDWDIVVEGDAIALAKTFARSVKSQITVFEKFGTATVTFANGFVMDFAMARSEYYPYPGSLPVVKPGSIKQDLFRRDFTINAGAIVLNPENFGQLKDFYGASDDLKSKKVRIMHQLSFIDDPTRILRAVRFEGRMGFKIEPKTLTLLKKALVLKAVNTVKPSRYFAEFRKIFCEDYCVKILKRLYSFGGLDFIAKDFCPDWKKLSRAQKKSLILKKEKFYSRQDWPSILFLVFFVQFKREQLQKLAANFHFTSQERTSLLSLGECAQVEKKLAQSNLSASMIYEILDPLDLQIIYFIRITTSVNMVSLQIDNFLKKWRLVNLEITGEDLKVIGCQPGRQMGALLHSLLLNKIDGKIKNYQDELVLAKRLFSNIKGVK